MRTVRTVLNELRWRADRDFSKVEVEYVHRGAPGDTAAVSGEDILALEPWMMVIRRELRGGCPVPGRAAIPYHRIVRVLYDGRVVFDRSPQAGQKAS